MIGIGVVIGKEGLQTAVDQGAALFKERTGEEADTIALPIGFGRGVVGYSVAKMNSQPGVVLVGKEKVSDVWI